MSMYTMLELVKVAKHRGNSKQDHVVRTNQPTQQLVRLKVESHSSKMSENPSQAAQAGNQKDQEKFGYINVPDESLNFSPADDSLLARMYNKMASNALVPLGEWSLFHSLHFRRSRGSDNSKEVTRNKADKIYCSRQPLV